MSAKKWMLSLVSAWIAGSAIAAPGELDTTFASSGREIVTSYLSLADTFVAHATAIQPDGKIVMVGSDSDAPNANSDFIIMRVNSNGDLDTAFGDKGRVFVTGSINNAPSYAVHVASAVAIQPDGKIVVAGSESDIEPGSRLDLGVVFRLNSNGSVDTSFSPLSTQHTFVIGMAENRPTFFHALAIQPDGRILAAGEAFNYPAQSTIDFYVVRLTSSGNLDPTFIGDNAPQYRGQIWIPIDECEAPGRDSVTALALQPDGKIVLGGETQCDGDDYDFAFARLLPNGNFDTAFGYAAGETAIPFDIGGAHTDKLTALTLQPDGKIVGAGTVTASSGDHVIVGMTRLNSNGTHDTSFGTNGNFHNVFISERFGNHDAVAAGLQRGIDGSLWIGGYQKISDSSGNEPQFGYLHVEANGKNVLNSGIFYPVVPTAGAGGSMMAAMARDASGRMVLVGSTYWWYPGYFFTPRDFSVARLLTQ